MFGSARTPPGHPEYEHARAAGRKLGEAGFAIITGGGPGDHGGGQPRRQGGRRASIGLDIELPHEQARTAGSTCR